jgi:exosome complex component RRP4
MHNLDNNDTKHGSNTDDEPEHRSDYKPSKRELVVPGELLDTNQTHKAGIGTYQDGEMIYASQLGFKDIRSNYLNVISFGGKYIPRSGDSVIGKVTDIGPTNWTLDINSPYTAVLNIHEVPWDVEFGATSNYIDIGEAVLIKITNVDEIKRVQATMKGAGLRKLSGGFIIEISASKVPRIIGKSGTMISLLKRYTNCRMFVGQNGRIWLDGEMDNILVASRAINEIERKAHTSGLTSQIESYLKQSAPDLDRD